MNTATTIPDAPVLSPAIAHLQGIASAHAAQYSTPPNTPTTFVSFGMLSEYSTVAFEVPIDVTVDFVNNVAAATAHAGLRDVQFAICKRTSKTPKDLEAIYGIIVDVDHPTRDILQEVESAGVPVPFLVFQTLNGFKLVYVSTSPIARDLFEQLAQSLGLAFCDGDPTSWSLSQMQRVPICWKTVDGVPIAVSYPAMRTNAIPFVAEPGAVRFPHRALTALGAGLLAPADRKAARDYLESIGIPAPDEPGHNLYAACPACEAHDTTCCYVNVADDGELYVHCLGGHGGETPKHWTEAQLATLAGAALTSSAHAVAGFNPLRHLPVTPAAVKYIRARLREWKSEEVLAVINIWTLAWARREAHVVHRDKATVVDVLSVYKDRLYGVHGLPPLVPYYDLGTACLMHDDPNGRSLPVTGNNGPSLKTNALEMKATALWTVVVKETKTGIEVNPGWAGDAASQLHSLALGHPNVLAKLGVPAVTQYTLPVAFATESWSINPLTYHIEVVLVRATLDSVLEIDAKEFFLGLYRNKQLPLASEDDVRRFIMALASPLLRHEAPGLLGVYWLVGLPGSGKDFLAEMMRRIWAKCGLEHVRVSFDLSLAGELESKRMLDAGANCIYARAKEAGKRAGIADALIRMAGTDVLTARGLYKSEISISNTFTYVADSAEDMPDRREISRRTVLANVSSIPDAVSKGALLDHVCKYAEGIIKNLKNMVESQTADWYRQQCDTGSRPVVPVALAKLLGTTLPAVEGEDLTDIFEALYDYSVSPEGKTEGDKQLRTMRQRPKSSFESKTFPSYSVATFIDAMLQKAGMSEYFSPYAKKSKELIGRIQRETEYRSAVESAGYLKIDVRGRPYALRIEDKRRFILLDEVSFCTTMASARTASTAAQPPPAPVTPLHPQHASTQAVATPSDTGAPTYQVATSTLLKKSQP